MSSKNKDESPVLDSSNQLSSSGAIVRVLNTEHISGWHSRRIRVHVDQKSGTANTLENDTHEDAGRNELLFINLATTGQEDQMSPDGVVGTTCLINLKPDGTFLLSVENPNYFTIRMKEGQPLGKLVPVQMPSDAVTVEEF